MIWKRPLPTSTPPDQLAVNLAWGVRRMLRVAANEELESVDDVRDAILAEAQQLADEDVALNKRMAYNGAELISDGDTILHHCNTGALATVDWGTALGVVFAAHEQGKKIHVLVDETRPTLQGLPPHRLGTAPARHPVRPDCR